MKPKSVKQIRFKRMIHYICILFNSAVYKTKRIRVQNLNKRNKERKQEEADNAKKEEEEREKKKKKRENCKQTL